MSESINTALMLMAVGMITVFLILALIVSLGSVLIRFVNRFFPEKILEKIGDDFSGPEMNPRTIAVITAVVEMATAGKGRITEIKKVK